MTAQPKRVVDEDLDLRFDDQLIGSLTRNGQAPRVADVKAVVEAVNE